MKIDMIPKAAQTTLEILNDVLKLGDLPNDKRADIEDAVTSLLEAIDDEAERQYLERQYPESDHG